MRETGKCQSIKLNDLVGSEWFSTNRAGRKTVQTTIATAMATEEAAFLEIVAVVDIRADRAGGWRLL